MAQLYFCYRAETKSDLAANAVYLSFPKWGRVKCDRMLELTVLIISRFQVTLYNLESQFIFHHSKFTLSSKAISEFFSVFL